MNHKSLVIVESPAKAKTINRYLGNEFLVKASVGHIKDLPENKIGVDIENKFTPQYVIIKGKGKVINELKTAAQTSKAIYLAPDPDREGEAICWHLADELNGARTSIYRVIFNEITREGIAAGMANPGQIDLNKVNAQQARRILDRLVGYKLSPLLNKKVRKGLSAGRVQSVAVRLICEREREIEAFVPEEYWSIEAELKKEGGPSFTAKLEKIKGKKADLKCEEDAKAVVAELGQAEFKVTKVEHKEKSRKPAPPFITSTLQQEASKKLNFGVKKTMQIAQQLYEGIELGDEGPTGLITYMRTDSTRVAAEAQAAARGYIKGRYGADYIPDKIPVYQSKRGAQEAHEAIRPTYCERIPDEIKKYLEKDQYLLYQLIWSRFLASQMSPAQVKTTSVDIEAKDCLFRATGSEILFPGFMTLYVVEDEKKEEGIGVLPPLAKGDILILLKLTPNQHFTQPPPRYNEASLVKTLEEKGIGRPSTYAAIIGVITARDYVKREGGRFYPTELGMLVNDLLVENFPRVLDFGFTADMEDNLDKIEEGKTEWVNVLSDFWDDFEQTLKKAQGEMRNVKKEQEVVTDQVCELCGGKMIVKTSRWGSKFLGCENFPKCRSTKPLEEEAEETNEVCELCGAKMVVKRGRYGLFLSCSRYPECKSTKPITLGVPCPVKGCGGELVARRSKKGRTFYGCSRYPDCSFVTWYEPTSEKCPNCNGLLVKKKKKTGDTLSCISEECKYEAISS
ncbi:MAG: type I DNA topoisomerase [bacterium]